MTLRPFTMPTDLDTLANLLPPSFQYPDNPEWNLDDEELAGEVEQLQRIKKSWFIFRALMLVVPPLRDAMHGFIYEADGQAVGCINVARQGASDTWIIGNVAVLPEYRRRGIARQLVEAALDLPRRKAAHAIILDVIEGNTPAYQLYVRLGFEHYTSSDHYILPADARLTPTPLPDGLHLKAIKMMDWRTRFDFDKRITPAAVQVYRPYEEKNYRPPTLLKPIIPLLNRMLGQRPFHWGIEDAHGQLLARVALNTSTGSEGVHNLNLVVDAAGVSVVPYLLHHACQAAHAINPDKRFELEASGRVDGLREAIEGAGFGFRYRYDRLGILLAPSAN